VLPVWCGEFKNLEPAAHALLLLLQIHGQVQSNAEWELALIDPSKKQLPPAATTRRWSERVDLEATCHCRLSLASTQARSRPSPSLTYYIYIRIDRPPIIWRSSMCFSFTTTHHVHNPTSTRDHLITWRQRPVSLGRLWSPQQMNTVPSYQRTRAFNNETKQITRNQWKLAPNGNHAPFKSDNTCTHAYAYVHHQQTTALILHNKPYGWSN